MAETRISDESLLAGLRDIRLPDHASGGVIAEIAVISGVALIGAVMVSVLLGLLMRRTASAPRDLPLADQMAQLRKLDEPDRAVALLHLLRARQPEVAQVMSARLYGPQGFPDCAELEAALQSETRPTDA